MPRQRPVTRDPWWPGGYTYITGTRIPTWTIRHYDDWGASVEEIQRQFPRLTTQQIEEALRFEYRWYRRLGRWVGRMFPWRIVRMED